MVLPSTVNRQPSSIIQPSVLSISDNELILSYKQTGDLSCVGDLFKRYHHLVYGVCLKYLRHPEDAKDAVMQIFEKLIQDLKKHEVQYFKSWLYMVAKNHCLMKLRGEKRTDRLPENIVEEDDETVRVRVDFPFMVHPDGSEEKERRLADLEQALSFLTRQQKECIELFYMQEKSYQEIMAITGYTYMQVKSFIQNGKRNLLIKMKSFESEKSSR